MSDRPPPSRKSGRPPAGEDPLIGRNIAGKFEIQKLLGAGAMGAVYAARQTALDKKVAIKVLHRELATDATFAQRFQREARAASRLDHPNSIRVFDFGEDTDGLLYIVMEYVEGRDLFGIIEQMGPLPRASIVDILAQTLGALGVAHEMGVLHRDLKPENIMMVRGTADDGRPCDLVKVCDFGIAKIMETRETPERARDDGRKLTTAGLIVGTPEYMSPEQARGLSLDARSDLYSIGVILYHLLTGRVPFEAPTALDVVLKHISEPPLTPSLVNPGCDPALEAICMKALSKDPAGRYQSARDMRLAVRATVAPGAAPPSLGAMLDPTTPRASLGQAETLEVGAHRASKPTLSGVSPVQGSPRPAWSRAWLAVVPIAIVTGAILFSRFGAPHDRPSPVVAAIAPSSEPPGVLHASPPPMPPPAPAESSIPVGVASTVALPRMPSGLGKPHGAVHAVLPGSPPASSTPPPVDPPVPIAEIVPPPVAPAPIPAPPPPPPPPPPKFDAERARIDLGTVSNTFGTTPSNVNRALSPIESKLTACYRAALPSMTPPMEGTFKLHLETADDGTITDARFSGGAAGGLSSCIAAAATGRKIPNVDTGTASADVALTLRPR